MYAGTSGSMIIVAITEKGALSRPASFWCAYHTLESPTAVVTLATANANNRFIKRSSSTAPS